MKINKKLIKGIVGIFIFLVLIYIAFPKVSQEYPDPQYGACERDDCIGVIVKETCSATYEDELFGTMRKCKFYCIGIFIGLDGGCKVRSFY